MNKVLLVDADSVIPNLALMRISHYHKQLGDSIELIKLNMSYYPSRKKLFFSFPANSYDIIYCSIVFNTSLPFIEQNPNVRFGGIGFDIHSTLPEHIQSSPMDYSIYPDNDTAYGFISRGCIRNCSFCHVPKAEGMIRQVASIADISITKENYKKTKFLDNNFLALPNHITLLQELVDKQLRH